jgi:transmembrane sensor
MAHHQPGRAQLIAYFEGKITEITVREAIEDYLASGADPLFVQDCMQTAWENVNTEEPLYVAPAQWDKFRMLAGIRSTRKTLIRPMFAAAATLLLLIAFAAMYFIFPPHTSVPDIVWQQVTASPRELRTIHLPDGSTLTVFPGSTISYNNLYNDKVREVQLRGRAYFNVASVAGKPFSVTTGKYTTEVLGTSFEIFDQPQREELAVVVVSGKVRLLNEHKEKLSDLQPDQQMVIRTGDAQFSIAPVAAKTLVSWTSGRLSYDQALLADVCRDLENWYGTRISIQRTTLGQKRITAGFEGMPLSAVMNILSQTAGFTYKEVKAGIEVY